MTSLAFIQNSLSVNLHRTAYAEIVRLAYKTVGSGVNVLESSDIAKYYLTAKPLAPRHYPLQIFFVP